MRRFSSNTFVAIFIALTVFSCEKKPEPTDPPEEPKPEVFVNKNAETSTFLLEEFTGIACGYCPDGHKRADQLAEVTFPGKFFIINVHAGGYADFPPPNDLRTDFSSSLVTFGNATSFPSGMINRTVFPGKTYKEGYAPMSRSNWEGVAMSIANEPTYVNVAAKTTINASDRTLTCKVQAYYTADAPVAVNHINIAILQNELINAQINGAVYYPERVIDGVKYRHMHVLRHFVTGQWGEAIDVEKKKDNLYEKTFTWTIPAEIRTLPIPLENVEVLVFITEGIAAPVVKVCKSSIEVK